MNGNTKTTVVGRVKIEKRPLMLVEAEYEGFTLEPFFKMPRQSGLFKKMETEYLLHNLKIGDKVMVYPR